MIWGSWLFGLTSIMHSCALRDDDAHPTWLIWSSRSTKPHTHVLSYRLANKIYATLEGNVSCFPEIENYVDGKFFSHSTNKSSTYWSMLYISSHLTVQYMGINHKMLNRRQQTCGLQDLRPLQILWPIDESDRPYPLHSSILAVPLPPNTGDYFWRIETSWIDFTVHISFKCMSMESYPGS